MAYFLAVANRKGGVGKSTVSVMLAYAFAVWSARKVLVVDLDAQSNSSLILQGGEKWIEAQRQSRNIAAYIEDRFYGDNPIRDYVVAGVGDVMLADGRAPNLYLVPGSLKFEDMQDELVTNFSKKMSSYNQVKLACAQHFRTALNKAMPLADLVILDCAPGLSNATAAAIKLADKVVVPFRPDAVSEFAVDRISTLIEGRSYDDVVASPPERRRYVCLANYVRPGGRDQIYVDTISANHPVLATRLPMMSEIASAFDFTGERQTLEEKYGSAVGPLKALHAELAGLLDI